MFSFRTALICAALLASGAVPAQAAEPYPTTIPLPDGFRPEGIAISGQHAYFGSMGTGAIHRVDLATGRGEPFVRGTAGTAALGLKVDERGRLFVAGGGGGTARVIDTRDGTTLATYRLSTRSSFVNDVVLTPEAAWLTDSTNAVVHKLAFGRDGALPARAETVRLTGDIVYRSGTNGNGIETTPDGRALIIAQHNTGTLFRVDPATGVARTLAVAGGPLSNTDGLLRSGSTLYVMENRDNRVAVVALDAAGASGTLLRRVTDPRFDVPTTAAAFQDRLYLPNGRFTTPPGPGTAYTAVSIPKP
ncbi:superoxide dismutase [Actinosynnema sp. NPDC047251]|uniref:Superoxide dismutase n=1 Tax=Saccharothrix espanaensis (strain ATCC 51144 / DSM 44229 / JCM 9112 / NBRC 15066 / NRRL 15764) TaxID=1179773 RepID=K0K340_SACES|nr:superoxide dismutase [Saccharothrix espanaensis]CCH30978.1 Superoxide dismutase [Saccharothrix espanaensis DSM 44229]